jgi:hypothetical protein
MAAALIVVASGCGVKELPIDYGRQDNSVNGCLALARMFAASGRPVTTRHALTPGTAKADTIVWFPNSRMIPTEPTIKWLERWLGEDSRRTLIYVGRDYDAEPDYWRQTTPLAPVDQKPLFESLQASAEARVSAERLTMPAKAECDWFQFEGDQPTERAETLTGPWSAGVDPTKTELEFHQRLISPPGWQESLLETPTAVLVARGKPSNGGELLLIVNGSFLLNERLVNPENRKLAGRLISATEPGGQVVFLESSENPQIRSGDDPPHLPQSLELLTLWPLNVVLLHFAVLGIIFCFARWPIFGRPDEPPAAELTSFAKHAEALGKLLERSQDRAYAERRLAEYRALKT